MAKIDFINILRTAFRVLTSPAAFFSNMPKTGGYIEPLVFMVVMGFIGSFIQALLSIMGLTPEGPEIGAVSLIIVLIIAIIASGFMAATVYFIIWRLMGSKESFETAFRCNAYISALIPVTALLGPVPYLDQIIAILLSTLFLVIASVCVHNLPSRRAWIVFGLLGLMFMLASIVGNEALKALEENQLDIQEVQYINKKTDICFNGQIPDDESEIAWKSRWIA